MNNKNTAELVRLVAEHPNLPIIPLVSSEVVCDDSYSCWLGDMAMPAVGEYACYGERFYEDRDEFEEDYHDYNYDWIDEQFPDDDKLDEYLHKIADSYFKLAIIVRIVSPKYQEDKGNA